MSKIASVEVPPSELYERDYYAWIQGQVRALRNRRLKEIDWANVAEEIEDWGKSEKRSVESHIARIVEHLLKLYLYASPNEKLKSPRLGDQRKRSSTSTS